MSLQPIAITGSTGQVGGRIAARLADQGLPQRLLVRDPARAPQLPDIDVRQIAGYSAAADVRAALEGVETLLLVPATESEDRVQHHITAIDAAAAAGVSRIVYLSFLSAAADATFTFARDHFATEEHIRSTGLRFAFLRMNLYLDVVPMLAGAGGVIQGPAGNGRLSAVLRDDVAASAAAVLTSEGHDGQTYDLTGPDAFTLAEAAATISRVTGKPTRFQDETLEEARASRAVYEAPDWKVQGWITTHTAIASGELGVRSDAVERLTGRPPTSLEAFVSSIT